MQINNTVNNQRIIKFFSKFSKRIMYAKNNRNEVINTYQVKKNKVLMEIYKYLIFKINRYHKVKSSQFQ